jgi:predicted secreted protein
MDILELNVGERRTLVLEGRGSAGYGWSATVDDRSIATVEGAGTVARGDNPAGATGGRDEVFAVTAHAAGETRVHFALARPWETGKSIASREFRVIVNATSGRTS